MSDEDCLQAHLDAQPGDAVTRLVLADLFEEQGRDDEAKAQRWLAEMKLWPDNDLAPAKQPGWHWWSSARGKRNWHRSHAVIPLDLRRHMPIDEWLYETRLQAEGDLLKALREAGKL
jgi:uncharacterized protein (TIGR02996 family)